MSAQNQPVKPEAKETKSDRPHLTRMKKGAVIRQVRRRDIEAYKLLGFTEC